MPRKLGYGGLSNTNGARDFTGKTGGVVSYIARKLGYGGLANTVGSRDFTGKAGAIPPLAERVLGYGGIANSQARDFSGKAAAPVSAWVPKPMVPVGGVLGM